MARISYRDIGTLPPDLREFVIRRGGLNVFRMLANAENVFRGWAGYIDAHLHSDTFSPRLRELVTLRVAHLQQSPYEVAQHTDLARQAGVSEDQLAALQPEGDIANAGFGDDEVAILRLITEMLTTKHVTDATFAPVLAALGEAATVELLMHATRYAALALILNTLEVDIDATARLKMPETAAPARPQEVRSS